MDEDTIDFDFGEIGTVPITQEQHASLVMLTHEFGGLKRFDGEQLYQYYLSVKGISEANPSQRPSIISKVKKEIRENISSQVAGRDPKEDAKDVGVVLYALADCNQRKAMKLAEWAIRQAASANILIEADV